MGQSAAPPAGFADVIGRNFAQPDAAAPPIVGVDAVLGDRAEHPPVLLRRVRDVLAERRNHVDLGLVGKQIVEHFGQPARPAVRAGDVGRQQQHAPRLRADPLSRLGHRLFHQSGESLGGNPMIAFNEPRHGKLLFSVSRRCAQRPPSQRPKIIRPALVCKTLVTATCTCLPMCSRPPSITTIVPSSR